MSGIQRPEWREGAQRLVQINTPDPGREIVVPVPTVPEAVWWEIISARLGLVASAAAGNRTPALIVDSGSDGGDYAIGLANGGQAPSTTVLYFFSEVGTAYAGLPPVAGTVIGRTVVALPYYLKIQSVHRIKTLTQGLDAADQLTLALLVREWTYVPPVDVITGEIQTMAGKLLAALEKKSCGCPLVATAVGAPTDQ